MSIRTNIIKMCCCKLFIKYVFDAILLKFVFEVIVRFPIKNVFGEA